NLSHSLSFPTRRSSDLYALTLGDMTWETYWQQNSYALPEYLKEVHKINAPVFHTIGNHDNDPTNVGDWDTAGKFRTTIGPNYYRSEEHTSELQSRENLV